MDKTNSIRIVETAYELFNIKGYRNVTISELANKLGMSKKTIYKYFDGKEEIAAQVVEIALKKIDDKVKVACLKDGNPMDILRETLMDIKDEILRFNPLFLQDIQKYIPQLWKYIEEFRKKKLKFVEELLKKAEKEGLLKDINTNLAMIIFLESVQNLVKPDVHMRYGYSVEEVLDTLINIFFTGIRI